VYVLNRSPTKSVEGVTPYEAWHGKKPRVDHLRVFGCVGHVKNNGPSVKKLSDRSIKMVCLGYAEGTKGYKMYDLVAKRVHLSRDVIFEENRGWDWNTNSDIQNRPDFL
jgi:hypothetical protein